MSNPPGTLGLFELQSAVGDVPVGTVYRAQRKSDGVPARVVVIERSRIRDTAYRQRFLQQAQTATKIQHSNLEALLDGGEAGGEFFLATEWIEGLTITEWLAGHGPVPEPTAFEITRCCAQALKHAWDTAQLLHGGLTVEDIIVQQDGVVKLRGLALAKPAEGSRIGDFRALGGALYQMLVAEPPPQPGHRMPNLADKRPGLNPFVGDVLEKMLAADPKWNFPSYDEIIQDLTALIEGRQPSSAKPVQLSVPGGLSVSTPAPASALSLSVSPSPAPAAAPKVKVAVRRAGGAPTPPPPAAGGSMQLSVSAPPPGSLQLSVSGPTAPDESTLPSYAREQVVGKKKTDWKLLAPPVAALIVVGIGWFGADKYVDYKREAARKEARAAAKKVQKAQPAAPQQQSQQAQAAQPAQAQPQPAQPAQPAAPPPPPAPEFDRDALAKYRPVHAQWVELIKADCYDDAAQLCEGVIPAFRQMNQPVFVTAMEREASDARRLLKLKDGLKAHAAALVGQKLTVGSDQLTVQSTDGENVTFATAQGGSVSHPFPHVVVGRWKSWLACHAPPGVQPDRDVVIAGALFALYALSDAALAEECLQIAATLGVDVTRYRALCKQSPMQAAPIVP